MLATASRCSLHAAAAAAQRRPPSRQRNSPQAAPLTWRVKLRAEGVVQCWVRREESTSSSSQQPHGHRASHKVLSSMHAAGNHLDQGSPLAAVLAGKVGGGCSKGEQGRNSAIWGLDRWASTAIWVNHTHSGPPRRECLRWGHHQRRERGPRRPEGGRRGRRTSWLPGAECSAARLDAMPPEGRRSPILRTPAHT